MSGKTNIKVTRSVIVIAIAFLCVLSSLRAARIKDIAEVQGASGTQVIGYGLVTGLNNTGDNQQASFTVQSVSNMLKRFGLTVPQINPRIRNVAAVMVTAYVPAFLKPGSRVDVQVSSIGDATSLQGGVLLMTPMSASNGEIIGAAQGAMSVGGYDYRALGSRVSKNFVTSGRVPNGLILEKEIKKELLRADNVINVVLREPDFTTASRVATAINDGADFVTSAAAIDAATIEVELSPDENIVDAIAGIDTMQVQKDVKARVVINERTGTIVVGGNVTLEPAVIAHGDLEIQIQRNVVVLNKSHFPWQSWSLWHPPYATEASITTEEEINPAKGVEVKPPSVGDMEKALNALQVKPRDLISIFQALKGAGVLQGELIIQ